jgi:uncharacterized protein YbjT (DUF2867 family)
MSDKKNLNKERVLVLGANGKTGSRVLQRLNTLGWPTQIGSRSANPKFDWEDDSTWSDALKNIHSVYVSFYPDLALPGTADLIKKFTQLAVKNGVQKLVLLSGRGEEEAQACEDIVMKSGVDWTIVRASWFFQNFSEGNFLEPILAGHIALPSGDVGEPFIDADDIADVAVAALTQTGHSEKLYEVTGPRLLTFKKAIEEISAAAGRPIIYEQVSMQTYTDMLSEWQVPKELVSLLTYLFTEVLDGRNENVTDGVEQALGRKATDFSKFVKKTAESGVWSHQDVRATKE